MRIGALEAGGTKMVCAVGNENGEIYEQQSFPTVTPQETLPQLLAWFQDKKIEALGIGCFGPIDLHKDSPTYGYITTTPKLAWQNCDIVGAFKSLHVPVGFDTDVNGSLLGEITWGIGKGLSSCIYITVGTGVGVGILTDGHLLHGMLHSEAGHILLTRHPDDSYPGRCPFHKNCLEGMCAGPAVEERWGAKGKELADRPEVWEMEAYYLAQALFDFTLMVSPQRIILGGGIMHQTQLLPMIRKQFTTFMNGYLQTKELQDLDSYIVVQSLDDKQGIMGALKLGLNAKEEQ